MPEYVASKPFWKINFPMGLLQFSPELISTINIIPGYFLGPLPVLVVLGLFLAFFSVLVIKFSVGKKIVKDRSDRLLLLFLAFWSVLLLAFTAGNYREARQDINYYAFGSFDKKIMRVCCLGDLSGRLCRIFSGGRPDDPVLRTYYDYYSFPRFNN